MTIQRTDEKRQAALFLTAKERETVISWSDENRDHIFIYSSQQPMIRKLLKNPLFECSDKRYNRSYACYSDPISIEGYLPRKALTLRTKIRKLTKEQRRKASERLKHARQSRKP